MATLLLVTIPFLAATIAGAKKRGKQQYSAVAAVVAGIGILVVVGLALNGSIAGYGLTPAMIALSILIFVPPASRLRYWILGLAALLAIGFVVALESTAIGETEIGQHATNAVQSRVEILSTTSHAVRDFMPFGSGLGSFRQVYPLYESWTDIPSTIVIHVHNDYAEVALELGIAGVVLMLAFLAWWALAVARIWRTAEAGPFARAAAIASAAVLIHSLVDFPLRTAAIAACFGMCVALLADGRAAPPEEKAELRRTRHVEFR
jgi:O-antigen ligase